VIPERRILVYVAAMITGIILVMRYDAERKLPQLIQSHKVEYQNVQSPNLLSHYVAELSVTTIAAAAIVLMIIVLAFIVLAGGPMKAGRSIIFRSGQSRLYGGWWRDIGLSVLLAGFWFLAGIVAAIVQLAQMPDLWQGSSGTSLTLSGTVEQVDGRSSDRLRLWVRVDADLSSDTTSGPIPDSAPLPSAVAGYLARLSIDAGEAAITTPDGIRNVLPGDRLQLAARIYPSPPPVFYGRQTMRGRHAPKMWLPADISLNRQDILGQLMACPIVLHGIARYAPISLLTACLRRRAVLRRPCWLATAVMSMMPPMTCFDFPDLPICWRYRGCIWGCCVLVSSALRAG
jgi:hypothetical protein